MLAHSAIAEAPIAALALDGLSVIVSGNAGTGAVGSVTVTGISNLSVTGLEGTGTLLSLIHI